MRPADEVPPEDLAELHALLAQANTDARRYLTSEQVSQVPVVAVWREAYRKFRTKRGARCSIENLIKRVSKDNAVGPITPSVDIYNTLSLRYALPMGGEDLSTFVGDMMLEVTDGGDAFRPLGEDEDDPTLPGEVAYVDDVGAVCRCWNWRDGQRTALTDDTADAFLIVECVDPARASEAAEATDEFARMVERYMHGSIQTKAMVTRDAPSVVLSE
jgi:DNA/RNA-binding domain of Phe-tRNA-synthetase-like protein